MSLTQQPSFFLKIKILLISKNNDRMKVLSVGGYLNRLLSFSSSSAVSNDLESGFQLRHDVESEMTGSNNNDYFFHDDIPDSDGMTSMSEVLHPDLASTENKTSTSNLIRRKSFTARNRALDNGRQ